MTIAHRGDGGQVEYLSTICHDISALKQSTAMAQNYARQLLRIQEQERRALALELHDQIGQQLAALKLNCATMQREVADSPMGKRLDDCLGIIEATLSQTRNLAVNLRPSVLDNLGLVPALKWYANQQAMRTDCAIEVNAELPAERLPAEVVTASFRIVQEAVNNALRHGQSARIRITLARERSALVVGVRDDGSGFDTGKQLVARGDGSGIGMVGMRERAELLGGKFSIRSTVGGGTHVRAELPLAETKA